MKTPIGRMWITIALLVTLPLSAQAAWPEKPITITVGYAPGGLVDLLSRAVADVMSRNLRQPVVVENRAGAGGAVASTALMKMPGDGYNLVATTSTTMTLDPMVAKLGFGVNDFAYVAAIGEFYDGFFALPERGWKTLNDAVTAAKSEGHLNYASTMTIDRMLTGLIAKKNSVKLVPLPTVGGADAITKVLGGHVAFGYNTGSYYPLAKDGKLQVLALSGKDRIPDLPDVPTLKELGYNVAAVSLIIFVAPKNTPDDIQVNLAEAFEKAAKDPKVVDLVKQRGLKPFSEFGKTLTATVRGHADENSQLIRETAADGGR